MQAELIELYAALEDSEKSEGRGPKLEIGYYHSEADADEASNGYGVQGGKGGTRKVFAVRFENGNTFILQGCSSVKVK